MITTDPRLAEEAAALRWSRRRRLLTEVATAGYASGYAAVVLSRHDEFLGFAIAFPFLAIGTRAAVWRWRDRAVEARQARVGHSLRQHRLVGWARPEQVTEEAGDRVRRAWWRRLGMGLVLAGMLALAAVAVRADLAEPGFAVFAAALAVWGAADLARQELDLRDARRWLADPPS